VTAVESDYQDWYPLREIAEREWAPSLKQLAEWARKRDTTGFPEPKETLGRYHFYDLGEVQRWVTLWRRATGNMGSGGLNDA
jgi:hypothetical protein